VIRPAEDCHVQKEHEPEAGQRPSKLELAREMVELVATWAGDRLAYAIVDSAYVGQELLRRRPANVRRSCAFSVAATSASVC
jgi:hypothetical protein